MDISSFVLKSALLSRPNFGHYTGTASEVRSITDRLFEALRRGILHVEIGQRYALRDAVEAHRASGRPAHHRLDDPAAVRELRIPGVPPES